METVLFSFFSILEIILINPYVHYAYSNLKNRTIVRKTVPYSTIFRREISTKLQDKHREFAVKYYAKFMNTNATIVFQFINYGGEARRPPTNHAEYHTGNHGEYQTRIRPMALGPLIWRILPSAFGVDLALQ